MHFAASMRQDGTVLLALTLQHLPAIGTPLQSRISQRGCRFLLVIVQSFSQLELLFDSDRLNAASPYAGHERAATGSLSTEPRDAPS